MKRVYALFLCGLILSSCGTSMANSNDNKVVNNTTLASYKENKTYEKDAAIDISASINVTDSVTGDDTPTSEASEKVSKIDNVIVSLFDDKSKFIDTFTLKKVEPTLKGQIIKFTSGFKAVPEGNITFKFVFNDKDNSVHFETQGTMLLKAKSIVSVTGELNQVSVKKDASAAESLNVNFNETKEASYTPGQMIVGLNDEMKEEDFKSELEKNGIKVTEVKKGFLKTYTVKFSEPSVAEALIIANKTNKFEYAEPNGIVTIQF